MIRILTIITLLFLPVYLYANNTVWDYSLWDNMQWDTTPTPTYTLTLLKSGKGSGTVQSNPSGISCGSTCINTFNENQQITLSMEASSNSKAIGWDGCDSVNTSKVCTVVMDENKTITARIANTTDKILQVTKVGKGSGSVTVTHGSLLWSDKIGTTSYKQGKVVTLKALADTGSQFKSWTGCDSTSGKKCTVTMSKKKDLTVKFKLKSSTDEGL